MSFDHVFLTGPPGIGKSTLIKKVTKILKESHGVSVNGFYTEELRENKLRIGFDVIGFDGTKGPLARTNSPLRRLPKVGKYSVMVHEFENIALPLIRINDGVVVIDEIGKMELFSSSFKHEVTKLLNNNKIVLLGTLPIYRNLSFVEAIRNRPNVKVIEISVKNRDDDSLVNDVVSGLLSNLPKI